MSAEETRRAARRYMQGWRLWIIPVPKAAKNPGRDGWQHERHTPDEIPQLWREDLGIGCLWGKPSNNYCDVDCDWVEAARAADHILPRTRSFGHPAEPKSHRIICVTDDLPKTKRYLVPGKEPGHMVVELLSTGAQSLLPPSWYSNGTRRQWFAEGTSARMGGQELREAVADIAAAAWLARNWPGEGARHDYAKAAAGYVLRIFPASVAYG